MKAVDPSLICVSFSGGTLLRIAQDMGLRTCAEIFADTDRLILATRKTIAETRELIARANKLPD